jgi:hypothetical protein
MRLAEIKKVATRQAGPTPRGTEQAADSRALVVLTPAAAQGKAPETHRQAPFLAQLLAIKDQHPQTREHRRAEPDEVLAAYRLPPR